MTGKIIGLGSYLPEKIVTNDDLSKIMDTSDEWITERTGIKSRHIADPVKDRPSIMVVTSGVQSARAYVRAPCESRRAGSR